jgi:hypothetical protein
VSGILAVPLVGFRLVPAAIASVAIAPTLRRWRGSNLLEHLLIRSQEPHAPVEGNAPILRQDEHPEAPS